MVPPTMQASRTAGRRRTRFHNPLLIAFQWTLAQPLRRISMLVFSLLVVPAVGGPLITPHSPVEQIAGDELALR